MSKSLWQRLLGSKDQAKAGPSETEMRQARERLARAARPVSAFRLGGQKPGDSRAASWWGGNFLAEAPEGRDGQPMTPLVQIRRADLPEPHQNLLHAEYFMIWIDPAADVMDLSHGRGIAILETDAPKGIAAVDKGGPLPCFQMHLTEGGISLPSWEDFAHEVPRAVASSSDKEWFFGAPQFEGADDVPVLIGGWPQWIQGTQWGEDEAFVMEIRSTGKGGFGVGDGGTFYVFYGPKGWRVCIDFF